MKFKAVIFDLDGTLLDTLYDLGSSGNTLLKRYNFPVHAIEKYKEFIGDGAKKLVERMLPEGERNNDAIEKFTLEFKQEYGKNVDLHTKPFPGIEKLLSELQTRGIKMAILSYKPHLLTIRCVEKLLPISVFEIVKGHIDSEPRKPNPKVALDIAQSLEVTPQETIFLGDMENDVNTARNGKFYPVAVSWGMRSKKQLADFGIKNIIDKPLDLLKCID